MVDGVRGLQLQNVALLVVREPSYGAVRVPGQLQHLEGNPAKEILSLQFPVIRIIIIAEVNKLSLTSVTDVLK